ncbi:MAG: hypothetical protein KF693_00015 [Nitrospira sp.]|nr:hypothetical protein [Nitrospira sp.]
MNRLSRMSYTAIVIMTLAIPGWTLAEAPAGSGNTTSNSKPNQSNALQDRATDMTDRQGSSVRHNQPKPKGAQKDENSGGPAATGPMGESSVGGAGPSGTHPLPPEGAPGYEGEHPGSKR